MLSSRPEDLLTQAGQLLNRAEEETERAAEDVVTHLICGNARQSLYAYLAAFLLKEGIQPVEPATLTSLLGQCRAIDARFETLNLMHVHCRFDPDAGDYCLDRDQVDQCLKSAQHARAIVMHETPGY